MNRLAHDDALFVMFLSLPSSLAQPTSKVTSFYLESLCFVKRCFYEFAGFLRFSSASLVARISASFA